MKRDDDMTAFFIIATLSVLATFAGIMSTLRERKEDGDNHIYGRDE